MKKGALKLKDEFEGATPALALGTTPPLPPGGRERFVVSLELSKAAADRLLVLARRTDRPAAGVVRDALGFYDFLQKEVGLNDTLFLQGKDGLKTELKF